MDKRILCLLLTLFACNGGEAPGSFTTEGSTGTGSSSEGTTEEPEIPKPSSSGAPSPNTSTSGPGTSSSSTSGNTTALPTTTDDSAGSTGFPDFPVPDLDLDIECQSIDFLFVVDNHSAGHGALANLKASLGFFVEVINGQFGDKDVHFLVTDVDEYWGAQGCQVPCFENQSCEEVGWPDYNCFPNLDSCDETWGAGIVLPSGKFEPCNVEPGKRYLTNADPENLEDNLWCLLNVGSHGNGVLRQAHALTSALLPSNIGPGGCNEGFIRENALLVIVIVTHLPDYGSSGNPSTWYDMVIAVKDNKPGAVVVLGLLDDSHLGNNICDSPFVDPELRLQTFVSYFPYSLFGSVCNFNYTGYYSETFEMIEETCQKVHL